MKITMMTKGKDTAIVFATAGRPHAADRLADQGKLPNARQRLLEHDAISHKSQDAPAVEVFRV